MSRKIIVCLDGTGNEIETNESNVLRLYKTLERSEDQLVYYHPGVGTMDTNPFAKLFWSKPKLIAGLIFGAGLETNVLRAYEFLCRHYQEGDKKNNIDGDRLYFFGYSRGAYTARALAGFINDFGLVDPQEFHLVAPVFRAWRAISNADDRKAYAKIRMLEHAFTMRYPAIRFLGLWDTVSSLLRVKLGKGTFIQYGTHSSVDENPSVESVRHVLAIDETRRFFRHQFWTEGQKYYGNRFKSKKNPPDQDVKQVWFAGTHTDVAGSVYEPEAGLAKITMNWMRQELDGLKVDKLAFRTISYNRYVLGKEDKVTAKMGLTVSKPDPSAPLHSQMKKGWFILEIFPRLRRRCRWPKQWSILGYYIPWGQYRYIPPESDIHPTALERRADKANTYDPPNLKPF
ncbi:DUF2235 domain-containing protein [Amylibacter sp. IMCC11727]|uniref:DUF2235 domain-containing protein n=1 Tax=Amylibacter sp. IMCC11727 TaxID=3039851 RepID=UPI00244DD31B|nr:DUF2235 domain-containing protein [Amylibacter sp. IMCC11727]WGI22434.1 DUF2235 domain-containing protein [Amylibacter sp. IMCC11727]